MSRKKVHWWPYGRPSTAVPLGVNPPIPVAFSATQPLSLPLFALNKAGRTCGWCGLHNVKGYCFSRCQGQQDCWITSWAHVWYTCPLPEGMLLFPNLRSGTQNSGTGQSSPAYLSKSDQHVWAKDGWTEGRDAQSCCKRLLAYYRAYSILHGVLVMTAASMKALECPEPSLAANAPASASLILFIQPTSALILHQPCSSGA